MGYIIFGVLVLLYLVLAYLAAKTWPVGHVVLLVGLFLASLVFLVLAAANLKTQARWRNEYNSLQSQLNNLHEKNHRLEYGDSVDEDEEPSLLALKGEVTRTLIDRGRVWRNLALASVQAPAIVLSTQNVGDLPCQRVGIELAEREPLEPIEQPDEAAAPAGSPTGGRQVDMLVHAFHEVPVRSLPQPLQDALFAGQKQLAQQDEQGVCKVPGVHLGEFRVTAVSDNDRTVTVEPTAALDQQALTAVQDPNNMWVLYDILPADSHDVFQDLKSEQLRALFAQEQMGIPAETYANEIAQYERDGQQAESADPPERTWVRVRFLKEAQIDVDVPEPESLPEQPFDPSGRSKMALLNQDGATEFREGDEALFDATTANQLISEGTVQKVGTGVYFRPLRDYALIFQQAEQSLDDLAGRITATSQDLERLKQSQSDLQARIAFVARQKEMLEHDLAGFQKEVAVLTEYTQALEDEWQQTRERLSRLYRANKALESRLRSAGSPASAARIRRDARA